ncbi:ATP-dependent DNA helicase HFM1 isoform X1 [Populus alba x Populus x berolinensis]|nr:ATP-dependent DNA helicase HFM1 isoform X1 [Populus alba x Populus x berolinensis]
MYLLPIHELFFFSFDFFPEIRITKERTSCSIMDSYTLKSVSDLPPPFRSIFSFRYFNSLQSECFPVCYHSDVNMVISAPTGSGKTVLFELCVLRLLSRFVSEGRFVHVKGMLKTIYIAPSKALVQEKLRDWTQKFGSLGINCLELTGDNEFYNTRTIQEADIILTTPEKFDSVTRYRIKDGGLSFFSDIGLLLIDEVHLLNDPRGAALEAIVSRIKMLAHKPEMKSSPLSCVRFLAVSATIPNIEDLAEWLNVPVQGIKRFGEEMRPVKLTTKVFDILMHYSRGKSALVFCSTRKGAQEAALKLSQTAMTFGYSNPFIKDKEQQERLREASLSCSDKQLQSYILYGVGYHNGGLCLKDRSLIEGLFLKGDIKILCTTNTLAHGINLPAHTVVIKSTQHFNKEKGLYMEYDRSMILQVHLYENILSGCEMVESQLLSCVTEHLTAEIVQLTVSDIARAIEWMKCSYLFETSMNFQNPEHYAVKQGISRDRIEKQMQEITVQKVNELSHHQMIWTDKDGFLLKPLEPGRLMTRYYLKFNTMKHVMQTPENCSLEDALNVICHAEEIAWIQLRRNEKKLLNDINIDKDCRIRFHINGDKQKRKKRIQTREEKIFVLANDCLTGDPSVHDLSLTQDTNSICSNGCRIARCMKEYFIFKRNYKGAINSTLLAKSLYQKLWDDSPYLLKQLPGIGMVTAKALHSMGIKSFDTLAEADPRRIEILTGRKFPFGNHIKDSLLSLPPKVSMSIEENECHRRGMSKFVVTLTRLSQPLQSSKRHYADMIVGTEEDNLIHFHEKIR